jgi:sugar/nucleoside kinase (ribokinase family)
MSLSKQSAEAVVAGHICLDIIPRIETKSGGIGSIVVPGKLVEIGPALASTGGAVANTGIALHRLGIRTKLMGKVGGDMFGRTILRLLKESGEKLSEGMIVSREEFTSYSVVINPPDTDRTILHCPGTNDTFSADDVRTEDLAGARLFHFGYPPLMKRMYEGGGEELKRLLDKAKGAGLTVTLDMARPDPDALSGQADWPSILRRTLPFVDVFLPSFDEILFMLRPRLFRRLSEECGGADLLARADGPLLSSLADELLGMGTAVVALKLGEHGLYVKTSADRARLQAMGACAPDRAVISAWSGRELLAPCFRVKAVGTTGAGDCTIAGFLAGMLRGLPLEETMRYAVAAGACNVEAADAISGIPQWRALTERMASGWAHRDPLLPLPGWAYRPDCRLWASERDAARQG